jgi:hypothetical protein
LRIPPLRIPPLELRQINLRPDTETIESHSRTTGTLMKWSYQSIFGDSRRAEDLSSSLGLSSRRLLLTQAERRDAIYARRKSYVS